MFRATWRRWGFRVRANRTRTGLRFSFYAGLDIGRDSGTTVDAAYRDQAPYAFAGTAKKVVIDLKPEPIATKTELHQQPTTPLLRQP